MNDWLWLLLGVVVGITCNFIAKLYRSGEK
jgi:hypothetical protein